MIITGVYIVENTTGEYHPMFGEKYKKGRGKGRKMSKKEEKGEEKRK
jgi:hypothetical protein